MCKMVKQQAHRWKKKKESSTGANIAHNGGHNVETADSEITTDAEYGWTQAQGNAMHILNIFQ